MDKQNTTHHRLFIFSTILGMFFLCLVGALVLVLGIIIRLSHGEINSGPLSTRAKEFIQTEKEKGESIWTDAEFSTTQSNKSIENQTHTTPCFSITVPFQLVNTKVNEDKGPCVFEARVVSPPARLVIGAHIYTGSFAEYTGILHRIRNPDLYEEMYVVYNNNSILQTRIFKEEEGVTIFSESSPYVITIAFTSMTQPGSIKDSDIRKLLQSLKPIPQSSSTPTPTY